MEATSEWTIERLVLGRIVPVIEILLVEEAICRRPLDTLRAMFVISVGCPVVVDLLRLGGNHFGAQTHELIDFVARHLILHLPHHCRSRGEPRFLLWVWGFEVGHVEVVLHLDHVLVNVRRLGLVHHGVGICEEEMSVLPVPCHDDVVVEPLEYNYDFIR